MVAADDPQPGDARMEALQQRENRFGRGRAFSKGPVDPSEHAQIAAI
jgi:hypothetical protein